jgi:gluconokinase
MLSDVFGRDVKLNETVETGAVGAAMMALKALGLFNDYSEMKAFTTVGQEFAVNDKVHDVYKILSKRFNKGSRLMLEHAV